MVTVYSMFVVCLLIRHPFFLLHGHSHPDQYLACDWFASSNEFWAGCMHDSIFHFQRALWHVFTPSWHSAWRYTVNFVNLPRARCICTLVSCISPLPKPGPCPSGTSKDRFLVGHIAGLIQQPWRQKMWVSINGWVHVGPQNGWFINVYNGKSIKTS